MRDNWCVGYSRSYTAGVWVGNFSGEPMRDVTGVTGAAPVWVEVMNRLHREADSAAPSPSEGVVARAHEWFLRGTEAAGRSRARRRSFGSAYPAAGTIVALDPDIPSDRQKLFFEADPDDSGLRWTLDGEKLESSGGLVLWTPRAGRHTLGLADPAGRIVDTVDFEVRGSVAPAHPPP